MGGYSLIHVTLVVIIGALIAWNVVSYKPKK